MSSQNRIVTTIVIAFVVLAIGAVAHFILRQFATPSHSLLLYTSRPSIETITNWIINTDTGKKWEVGKGLASRGWSPSGKYLAFHTLPPASIEIWVSNNIGGDLHLLFDARQYPDLKITGYDWLSDEIILVNVVNKTENWGYLYVLNINSLSFEKVSRGNFINISPNGKFWLHYIDQYYLMDLNKNMMPVSLALVGELYAFLPDRNQWVYFCDRKGTASSLCLADVSMNGVTNEHKIANVEIPVVTLDIWWSHDGKYVGIQTYDRNTDEIRFRAIDVSNGTTMYDWMFPTKDTRNFWSPRGDKIIDWGGLLLDLNTGQVSNFFEQIQETTPSYVVDWRMIEIP